MRRRGIPFALSLALAALAAAAPGGRDGHGPWPQWRGPLGTGVAPSGDPPVSWSERDNVRWKTAIPGKGHSSPVVWGETVFLTTAVPHGEPAAPPSKHAPGAHHNVPPVRRQALALIAVDRGDGSIRWKRTLRDELPHHSTHETGSWASASPVTDGRHVIAFFGSGGLYGLDMSGEPVWSRDLGEMDPKHGHGEGSSPALHGNTVVINWDHEGQSFLVALDKRTGKTRWRVERDEPTSWSSPLIVEHRGRSQVVVAATRRVRGYDLADGKVVWECAGLSDNVVATPVAADGVVYVASSYDTRAMLAIRLDRARGDVTGTDAVLWTRDRDTPYVPSPVLLDDALCFLKHYQGVLTCVNPRSGRTIFGPARLPGIENVYASPVAAAGRLYVTDRDGTTLVLEAGPEPRVLARNQLDDAFSATPAIAGDALFLRGERNLYCLARSRPDSQGS